MARGRGNCCCDPCREFARGFAGSGELGDQWTAQAGSWSLAGGAAQTSDANALATFDAFNMQTAPDLRQRIKVTSRIKATADGDEVGIHWRWSSADHFYSVLIQFGTTDPHVRCDERSSGTTTLVGRSAISAPLDTYIDLEVCFYSAKHICTVWINGSVQFVVQCHAISSASPSRVGILTGSLSGTAYVDSLAAFESCGDVEVECTCPNCRYCGWPVDPWTSPDQTTGSIRQLQVEVATPATDASCSLCSNFGVATYVLDQVPQVLSVSSPDRCVYELELESPIELCPPEALYQPISRVEAIVRLNAGGELEILLSFRDAFGFGIANYGASYDQTTEAKIGNGPLTLDLTSGDSVCNWPATITIEALAP